MAAGPGLSSGLIHPRSGPFTTGHARHISVGRERWRPVVNAGQHCWKACWCRSIKRGTASVADKALRCDQAALPRYAPDHGVGEFVSAGQGRA
jgi:hypothetical protein